MEKDGSEFISEIKLALYMMRKEVDKNKISCRDFVTYCKILNRYISLGVNDYIPYVISLLSAAVIVTNDEENYIIKTYTDDLKNIIVGDNNKKTTRR